MLDLLFSDQAQDKEYIDFILSLHPQSSVNVRVCREAAYYTLVFKN